jgi:hypothetical protein
VGLVEPMTKGWLQRGRRGWRKKLGVGQMGMMMSMM